MLSRSSLRPLRLQCPPLLLWQSLFYRHPSHLVPQRAGLATVAPPVTQDAVGARGPTAMVFMNMGGPSTTNDVQDFLSKLFVCYRAFGKCYIH